VRVTPEDALTLLDWKRRVFALYEGVRRLEPRAGWELWRATRDEFFRSHPQSPSPGYDRLRYFDHDPALRVLADIETAERERRAIETSGDGEPGWFTRFALARFSLGGEPLTLELYWLDAYGGGLFVPFRDATSGRETYGAGRYLLDTVKGADLGADDDRLVLDFNLAYNPSCAYDPSWVCPLAPAANRLPVAVRAGELVL